ncbi:hypothetical protein [Sporosarcina highlanderae]|uniref:DUF4190 domain-containing protein n=1 Tax=Sporosarcina highlanderae TaxID=3035916 RepID=A0ABT8JU46_9BACL|nr:hypothetical protein [Sporosarcina highlanderae]MDN4608086.1 hypothetical protein [Sporosarcina highlanderae]
MTQTHNIRIERNTTATLSLIFALIGFIFGIVPVIGVLLMPVWILAFILGIVGLFKRYLRIQAIIGICISLFSFYYHFSLLPGFLI